MAARRARKRTRKNNATGKKIQPSGPGRTRVSQRARLSSRVMMGLDRAAADWAALLEDPCSAKLVYPCYPSGNGGTVLMRVEADSIYGGGATETAGFGAWVPGYGLFFGNSTPAPLDTTSSLLGTNTNFQPGDTFLKTNCGSIRCVAACLQMSYPGSELSRAGVVGIGVAPADSFITNLPTAVGGANNASSAQVFRITCQHVQRMPQDVMECKWFPGETDQGAYSAVYPAATFAQGLAGRNAIVWSASGFPVSTGIRIRTVAVYEVSLISTLSSGQVQSVAPPTSAFQTSHVLRYLAGKDPQWYLHKARQIAQTIGSVVSYASQGAKAAGYAINGIPLLMA